MMNGHHAHPPDAGSATFHLVGGGIASLAAAVFLIRDGGVPGDRITIYEQSDVLGGSLDGRGTPEAGFLTRGGRMFEDNFVCTFDLLASIPSLETPGRTLKDDIYAFNREVVGSSRCRLVRGGERIDAPSFGLSPRHLFDLARLQIRSEQAFEGRTIRDVFAADFFDTPFWTMWSTTFAFTPWHSALELKRYMRRFIHLLPGFKRLEGILRTRFNQYDSLIRPIVKWLEEQGVQFLLDRRVADLAFGESARGLAVTALEIEHGGRPINIALAEGDRVLLTLGSMTDASRLGSTDAAPAEAGAGDAGSWTLWRRLAARHPQFGRPEVFCGDTGRTTWESFTVTLTKPDFLDFMETYTGNETGTGGIVTCAESGWLMSVVMFRQPHFANQSDDSFVFWGYGLYPDRRGNFIPKPMLECSGQEILRELAGQLRLGDRAAGFFQDAIVLPCRMPFITSQFMPRSAGDRPPVVPEGAANFALMGQFCELPEDTVFTVEYSVRSAMTSVYALLGLEKSVPKVRPTYRSPAVQFRALRTLLGG